MKDYKVSINQFAEFKNATDGQKRTIVKQQIKPNKFKIAWYQLPKARVKKSLGEKCDFTSIYEGISILMDRRFADKKKENNRIVSIDALQRFIQLNLPPILKTYDFQIIKPTVKSTILYDIEVLVAPDLIITGIINGKKVIGGIKVHIVKSKPFDFTQSRIVANIIEKYLNNEISDESTEVLPELCLSIDIFGDSIVSAQESQIIDKQIEEICLDVKKTWNSLLVA